ncbi:hypothetical protein E2C01_055501 [Portunus trituberculatus]|uniref:Uncharacterized protein n=1 Tax=Portunus trituberculatus TaxID=210409 RepID=A0A5B7GV64_PORTR|nr:hypothetical protein [Portunus trituberculatus]
MANLRCQLLDRYIGIAPQSRMQRSIVVMFLRCRVTRTSYDIQFHLALKSQELCCTSLTLKRSYLNEVAGDDQRSSVDSSNPPTGYRVIPENVRAIADFVTPVNITDPDVVQGPRKSTDRIRA